MSRYHLRASGLRLQLGGRLLLDELELAAEPGELVGIVGPSGSGKTSLLLVLAGVISPEAGSVSYERLPGDDDSPLRLGLVPQTIGLAANLTAAENVVLPLQATGLGSSEMKARTERVLTGLGLGPAMDRIVTELSGGQRQRVAVARALAREPDVLLADEATAELDGEHQSLVMSLFEAEAARGAVVVLTTHDELVAERCSTVSVLEDGKLRAPSLSETRATER